MSRRSKTKQHSRPRTPSDVEIEEGEIPFSSTSPYVPPQEPFYQMPAQEYPVPPMPIKRRPLAAGSGFGTSGFGSGFGSAPIPPTKTGKARSDDKDFEEFKKALIKKFTTKRVPPQADDQLVPPTREPFQRQDFVSRPGISEAKFTQLIQERSSLSKTMKQFKNKLKVMLFRGTHVLTYDARTNSYIPLKLRGSPIFWNELTLNEMLGELNRETGEFVFDDKERIDKFIENHATLWDSCVEQTTIGGTKNLLEPFLTTSQSAMSAPDTAITSINEKIALLHNSLSTVMARIRDSPVTVIDNSSYLTRIKRFLLNKTGAGTAASVLTNMIIYFQETARAIPARMASGYGHILRDEGMASFRHMSETRVSDAEELERHISELSIYLITILGAICIFPESMGQFIPFFSEIQLICLQIFGTAYAVNNYEEVSLMVGEYVDNLIKDSISAYNTASRHAGTVRQNLGEIAHHMYIIKSYVMKVFVELSTPFTSRASSLASALVPAPAPMPAIVSDAKIHEAITGIRSEIEAITILYGFDPDRESALQYFTPSAARVGAVRAEENPFYGMEMGGSRKRSKISKRNKKNKRKTNKKNK
jgi:hypothetical protein